LQTIAARNADPVEQIVVSVTSFESSSKAFNVIPQSVTFRGTVRTLTPEMRALGRDRIHDICTHTAAVFGGVAHITYIEGYPATVNHEAETKFAAEAATKVAGDCDFAPLVMGGEDFSYMLEERPGAYILMGNGDGASVHHPEYNFNDEAIPAGCSWWVEMAETRLGTAQ
jgi:hippurate hydrolase